jgi:hypothetical protein
MAPIVSSEIVDKEIDEAVDEEIDIARGRSQMGHS